MPPCATRHTVGRLGAYRSGVRRRWRPSAGSPPAFGVPPAPETSSPPAPESSPRAPAAGSLPAEPPPAPAAATPSSHCDRTGAPAHPARSRSAAPTPPIASPPPAPSRVRTVAASGPAARPQPRSSATPPLPPCPAPVAPAPRFACSRRSPHSGPPGLRPPPPRWAFAGRSRPTTPTAAAAARDGALAGAPSAGRVGEIPVASDRLNVSPAPPADQYLRIKSRACFQRCSRSRTHSNARRHSAEQKCCKGLRRCGTNLS